MEGGETMLTVLAKAIAYVVGAGAAATATMYCVAGAIENLEEASERAREKASAAEPKAAAAN
jgi:hypothetical protein